MNKRVIDEVNSSFARRISDVASTGEACAMMRGREAAEATWVASAAVERRALWGHDDLIWLLFLRRAWTREPFSQKWVLLQPLRAAIQC